MTASQKANHSRWCVDNPKSKDYRKSASERIVKDRTGSSPSIETREKIRQAHRDGKYSHIDRAEKQIGRKHTEETKNILRDKALKSPHRRLRKSTVVYKGILLDSSWELALAKRLDEIGVKWIRPNPIPWVDESGKNHHYFPDFYLPDHDIFLDPKNPHAVKVQKDKLDILSIQYTNIKILYSLEECMNFSL